MTRKQKNNRSFLFNFERLDNRDVFYSCFHENLAFAHVAL